MEKQSDTLPIKTEARPSGHRTLEERSTEYDGKLNLDGELDWRCSPVGDEIW